jgi:hypothetical protein
MTSEAQPATSTATSALQDQCIATVLNVETMTDLDTGKQELLLSTDANHGDLQVATADDVLKAADAARAQISRSTRLALAYAAATQPAPAAKPAWTIADQDTGLPLTVTCMAGCNTAHWERNRGVDRADEIHCTQYDRANTVYLPVSCGSNDGEDWNFLSVEITSRPVHPDPAKRIPVADVEVAEDHYITDLDPDGLAIVIDKIEQRVAAMHVRHAELVHARKEYLGRQA